MNDKQLSFSLENGGLFHKGHLMFLTSGLVFFLLTATSSSLLAQHDTEQLRQDAEVSVEALLLSRDEASLESFVDDHMVDMSKSEKENTIEALRLLRQEARPAMGNIGVGYEDYGIVFLLSYNDLEKEVSVYIDEKAGKISKLEVKDGENKLELTQANIESVFNELERDGFSGLIYVKKKEDIILERAFGFSRKVSQTPNAIQTIFGIGSRPIDFTKAAILLLDQQELISLNDSISKYFNDVPSDKEAMTIQHLMTGQSGLPDFFDLPGDWDADLHYIDRNTAVRRLLNQKLLFPPGSGRRHSHGAFGLLSALIEKASGTTYYDFIRKNFLDPAAMTRTGEYGEVRPGLKIEDFAEGGGPQFIGLPNIPPNWGKTSWLIKGSGGMYSTLGDLLRFYDFCRSGKVLDTSHQSYFRSPTVNVDGSMRGFELFNFYHPDKGAAYLFLNNIPDRDRTDPLFRALEKMIEKG